MIYLDTHVAAWLYAEGEAALSGAAADQIRQAIDIRISPMVRLELQCLYETGRVGVPAMPVVDELSAAVGIVVCPAAFAIVVREAERQNWTRDPFDRLIVAQAALYDAPLLTKDVMIHRHYPKAVW